MKTDIKLVKRLLTSASRVLDRMDIEVRRSDSEWVKRFNEIWDVIEGSLGRGFQLNCISGADETGISYRYEYRSSCAETEFGFISHGELEELLKNGRD